jgi:Oxidoreductase family, NAD-binding Rossmann fold
MPVCHHRDDQVLDRILRTTLLILWATWSSIRAPWKARDEINATHVGAEIDPSQLFWQGIDPTEATKSLGPLVYNAAAKDTRINPAAKINGTIDDSFTSVPEGDPRWTRPSLERDLIIMSDSIGVAVIGAGMAGRSHAHAYRTAQTVFGTDAPPVRLVAIADLNTDFANHTRDRYGFERSEGSWQATVDADDIDAVSIVVANHLHRNR